jgi:hypothetical protein
MAWARVISCSAAGGGGGSVRERGILDALAIIGDCTVMWCILRVLGHGMLKFVKGILYISRHGQVHMFICIIQFNSDAALESTNPVF